MFLSWDQSVTRWSKFKPVVTFSYRMKLFPNHHSTNSRLLFKVFIVLPLISNKVLSNISQRFFFMCMTSTLCRKWCVLQYGNSKNMMSFLQFIACHLAWLSLNVYQISVHSFVHILQGHKVDQLLPYVLHYCQMEFHVSKPISTDRKLWCPI